MDTLRDVATSGDSQLGESQARDQQAAKDRRNNSADARGSDDLGDHQIRTDRCSVGPREEGNFLGDTEPGRPTGTVGSGTSEASGGHSQTARLLVGSAQERDFQGTSTAATCTEDEYRQGTTDAESFGPVREPTRSQAQAEQRGRVNGHEGLRMSGVRFEDAPLPVTCADRAYEPAQRFLEEALRGPSPDRPQDVTMMWREMQAHMMRMDEQMQYLRAERVRDQAALDQALTLQFQALQVRDEALRVVYELQRNSAALNVCIPGPSTRDVRTCTAEPGSLQGPSVTFREPVQPRQEERDQAVFVVPLQTHDDERPRSEQQHSSTGGLTLSVSRTSTRDVCAGTSVPVLLQEPAATFRGPMQYVCGEQVRDEAVLDDTALCGGQRQRTSFGTTLNVPVPSTRDVRTYTAEPVPHQEPSGTFRGHAQLRPSSAVHQEK